MWATGAYMVLLANVSPESMPVWRAGRSLAMSEWAASIQLPVS